MIKRGCVVSNYQVNRTRTLLRFHSVVSVVLEPQESGSTDCTGYPRIESFSVRLINLIESDCSNKQITGSTVNTNSS